VGFPTLSKIGGHSQQQQFCSVISHNKNCIGFEVFTAATVKKAVLWDVTPCGSCKDRRFEGIALIIRVTRIGELGKMLAATLLVTVNVVPSSMIIVILMMEVVSSSETSVLKGPYGVTSQKTPFLKLNEYL
jgi:hypothetical protein